MYVEIMGLTYNDKEYLQLKETLKGKVVIVYTLECAKAIMVEVCNDHDLFITLHIIENSTFKYGIYSNKYKKIKRNIDARELLAWCECINTDDESILYEKYKMVLEES